MTTDELLAEAELWVGIRYPQPFRDGRAIMADLAAALRASETRAKQEHDLAVLIQERSEHAEAALAAQEAACEVHCSWGEEQRERAGLAEAALATERRSYKEAWGEYREKYDDLWRELAEARGLLAWWLRRPLSSHEEGMRVEETRAFLNGGRNE